MKKPTLIVLCISLVMLAFTACKNQKLLEKTTITLELKHQIKDGTNGMAVTYNANKKIYYAALGGSANFPIEVFDKTGKRISGNEAGADVRGMWWNTSTKQLECNTYGRSSTSFIAFNLDENNGIEGTTNKITKRDIQPSLHSVGAYDFNNKLILFYNNGKLYKVNRSNFEKIGSTKLKLPVDRDYINSTTIIYTGFPKKDVGVLDYENKKVYLFNSNTGEHTHTVTLPQNAVTKSMFWFSYANGYVWLYDKRSRSWTGYKIIK